MLSFAHSFSLFLFFFSFLYHFLFVVVIDLFLFLSSFLLLPILLLSFLSPFFFFPSSSSSSSSFPYLSIHFDDLFQLEGPFGIVLLQPDVVDGPLGQPALQLLRRHERLGAFRGGSGDSRLLDGCPSALALGFGSGLDVTGLFETAKSGERGGGGEGAGGGEGRWMEERDGGS